MSHALSGSHVTTKHLLPVPPVGWLHWLHPTLQNIVESYCNAKYTSQKLRHHLCYILIVI